MLFKKILNTDKKKIKTIDELAEIRRQINELEKYQRFTNPPRFDAKSLFWYSENPYHNIRTCSRYIGNLFDGYNVLFDGDYASAIEEFGKFLITFTKKIKEYKRAEKEISELKEKEEKILNKLGN